MNCPIKRKDMELLSKYQKKLMKEPQLMLLFLELTDSCNMKCNHCGSNCSSSCKTFLEYSVIEKLLKEVEIEFEPSRIMICITGGEPLLHPDIVKIVKTSREHGFIVGMTTNGTLITKCAAENLINAGLNTVAVSIDGLCKTHDAFRNTKGAFKQAIEGVYNFRSVGLEPQAVTVIHKKNLQELDKLFSLLEEHQFYSWRITTIEPIGRAKKNEDLLLQGKELKKVFDFIKTKRFDTNCKMEVTYGCSHFVTFDYEREIRDFYFQCGAGTKVAGIRANGNIVACLDIEDCTESIQGNIYKNSFSEIWKSKYSIFREDRSNKSSTCRNCGSKSVCMGDAAHTWDFDKNEPRYCIPSLMRE